MGNASDMPSRIYGKRGLWFALVLAIGVWFAGQVPASHAADGAKPAVVVKVEHPWARPVFGPGRNGVVFMQLTNPGPGALKLLRAASAVARRVELHTHIMKNGIMQMRAVAGGIALPAGQIVRLKPGGLHVMLLGVKKKLPAGTSFDLTLTFSDGHTQTIKVPVQMAAPK